MHIDSCYFRRSNETQEDHMIRLFTDGKNNGLSCTDIAFYLNQDRNQNYNESTYRKYWKAFNAGMEYVNFRRCNTNSCTKILCLSDFHFPYNLPIETFYEYSGNVDILVLNGDVIDQKEISRFARNYRNSPMDEIIGCRMFLIQLIEFLQPKRVVVITGNHESRFERYFSKNLDTDLIELMPKSPMEFICEDGFHHYNKEQKIKVWYEPLRDVFQSTIIDYVNNWYAKVGKTIFAHPLSYSSGMLKTTEKAVNYFYRVENNFDTIVMAHTHKLGSYIQGNVYMFEQGACCKVEDMNYADGKLTYPQQKGCLYLCQKDDGSLAYDKTKLISL